MEAAPWRLFHFGVPKKIVNPLHPSKQIVETSAPEGLGYPDSIVVTELLVNAFPASLACASESLIFCKFIITLRVCRSKFITKHF